MEGERATLALYVISDFSFFFALVQLTVSPTSTCVVWLWTMAREAKNPQKKLGLVIFIVFFWKASKSTALSFKEGEAIIVSYKSNIT